MASEIAKSLSKRFLQAYNQLDEHMRKELREPPETPHKRLLAKMIAKNLLLEGKLYELETFARLRNSIVHTFFPDAEPIAEPHERIVEEFEQLVRQILHPPTALSRAVLTQDIFTTNLDQRVIEVIGVMNSKVYTHVPLLQNGSVSGVFSENTDFSYMAHHQHAAISPETLMAEFSKFLPLRTHASEDFYFVPEHATIVDLGREFREGFAKHKRIAAIFITHDGTDAGKLLGLVTAADMAGLSGL